MSCKYCSHPDYQARGFCSIECRRFFEYEEEIAELKKLKTIPLDLVDALIISKLEEEIAELKAALTNIQAVAVNNLDHDMHRVYKLCDEALEATK